MTKKLFITLIGFLLIGTASYGQIALMNPVEDTVSIDTPDFRGVWKVYDEGSVFGFQIIWKDKKNQYQTIYMDSDNDVTKTLEIYADSGKLYVKSIYIPNDWKVSEVFHWVDRNTLKIEGENEDGAFSLTLKRMLTTYSYPIEEDENH